MKVYVPTDTSMLDRTNPIPIEADLQRVLNAYNQRNTERQIVSVEDKHTRLTVFIESK